MAKLQQISGIVKRIPFEGYDFYDLFRITFDNRIQMGNHDDCYPEEAASIRRILESYGLEVTEMHFKGKVDKPCYDLNWAYINFLQVDKNIIMPKFNIEEDAIALQYIQDAKNG